MQALTRAAQLHGMLERTNIDGSKVMVETVGISEPDHGISGDVGHNDSSDEEDLSSVLWHIQTNSLFEKPSKKVTKKEPAKSGADGAQPK